ncbi:MAG: DUF2341 domain-containing protein [Nanopusillaceae archaeon]
MKDSIKIAIVSFFLLFYFYLNISFAAWLEGWQYRRQITINNTLNSNSLTDYQVLITLDTASLISAGKMRSDCGDIRFTDSVGITLLNYWIESGCNTTNTRIWVKVPFIPANGYQTIYIYYGNSSATSQSNVSNTFIANAIYVISGSCSDSTNCGYMDNHAEADNIRNYPASICTKYVDKIDWGSPCDNSAFNTNARNYFYARFRFLFVPDVSGTWTFGIDSDDASELIKSNADMYGGIHEHTVIVSWYGGHGVANSLTTYTGTISLVAGQGIWLEFLYEEWGGNEGGRAGAQRPGGTMLIINTTNFPNQIFARKYTSPEPTITIGNEQTFFALNVLSISSSKTEKTFFKGFISKTDLLDILNKNIVILRYFEDIAKQTSYSIKVPIKTFTSVSTFSSISQKIIPIIREFSSLINLKSIFGRYYQYEKYGILSFISSYQKSIGKIEISKYYIIGKIEKNVKIARKFLGFINLNAILEKTIFKKFTSLNYITYEIEKYFSISYVI